ncbi:uncharacterized protein LOC131643795 [Vicia villosa]|uniref:uncharacterized protein LOC131643795 n=1 Tax=Vicia villosa TaxID=3911 RepID=UPI00273BC364|nr:uncharacterized protein LOC131643795 [Vicia villosa]
MFKKAAEIGKFEGYRVNNDLSVRILQFADDTVIVGSGCWQNLWTVKTIFRGFELISGMKVNFSKSKIYGMNLQESFMESASQFLTCCRDDLPFKFLGIMVGSNPRRCASWSGVVSSLKKKLSVWKVRLLSIGGRVTLLNSVLSSIPIYTMSFFKAPVKIIKDIITIQSRFLWGGNIEKKSIAWVSWYNICKPKEEGGLGVKHIGYFNKALLCKWKWMILMENGTLWCKILEARYGDLIQAVLLGSDVKLRRKD